METMFKILGLQAAFWGVVAGYAANDRQRLMPRTLPKRLGVLIFGLGTAASVFLFLNTYDVATGVVVWLCTVMVALVGMILGMPHLERPRHGIAWACVLFTVVGLID